MGGEISFCRILGILIIKRKLNKDMLILLMEKLSSTENRIERIMKDLLTSFHCEYQQILKHYATSQKVVGSSPDEVTEFF